MYSLCSIFRAKCFLGSFKSILHASYVLLIQNYGAFLEKDGAGFRGHIKLTGCKTGDLDITEFEWTYQVLICNFFYICCKCCSQLIYVCSRVLSLLHSALVKLKGRRFYLVSYAEDARADLKCN